MESHVSRTEWLTPELMKAMEKAERSRASGTTVEIPGVDTPETSKED